MRVTYALRAKHRRGQRTAQKETAGSPRPFRHRCRGRAVGEQRTCARSRRLLLAGAVVGLATRHAAAEIRLVAALRLRGVLMAVLLRALLGPILLRLLGSGHRALRFVVAHVAPLG